MNVETGELRRFAQGETVPPEFTQVPKRLEGEAQRLLGRRKSVRVPKNSPSPLAQWAAKRKKMKQQKKSRKRNR